jgi:hypothetical protein
MLTRLLSSPVGFQQCRPVTGIASPVFSYNTFTNLYTLKITENRSIKCYWPSPTQSFSASGLVESFDQDFFSLDMYVFEKWASSLMRVGVSLSVDALHLLHCSFSTRISML